MNLLEDYGYKSDEILQRVQDAYRTMFEGTEKERLYFETGDEGYILDTGNDDVRSEGMGFGMMMAVQMDKKEIFDRLWKFARTHLYIAEGELQGYYHFSCTPDGRTKFINPRPDGEEYMALSLFFAAHRWGNGEGIFNYEQEAKNILHTALHSDHPLWNKENYLICNKIDENHSDVSYNLPHFYELFAMFGDKEDTDFWNKASGTSREFIVRCSNKTTGMCAEYVHYNGSPLPVFDHGTFFSHSYVVAQNIALCTLWFGDSPEFTSIARRLIGFFDNKPVEEFGDYKIDGTPCERHSRHPTGLCAALAELSLAIERSREPCPMDIHAMAKRAVKRFWDTPLRTGKNRYYDNCLYFFALLALSGIYKVY